MLIGPIGFTLKARCHRVAHTAGQGQIPHDGHVTALEAPEVLAQAAAHGGDVERPMAALHLDPSPELGSKWLLPVET